MIAFANKSTLLQFTVSDNRVKLAYVACKALTAMVMKSFVLLDVVSRGPLKSS
jgi:hypothetical protein